MNIYFLVLTQPSNVGDLLINKMLIKELARQGKVYIDCYNCAADFRDSLFANMENVVDVYKSYHFTAKKLNLVKFASLLKRENIGLYTQSPGPLKKITQLKLRIGLGMIHRTIRLLEIPFYRIGNCCSEAIDSRADVVEKGVSAYFLRSTESVNYLKSLTNKPVKYIPDLAYLYNYEAKSSQKDKIAVLCFRKVKNIDNFLPYVSWIVDYLRDKGYIIRLAYQVKQDASFTNMLYEYLKKDGVSLRGDIIWYDNLNFYENVDIVLSNRLHSLLIGAMHGAIPVAFTDSDKVVRKIEDVYKSSLPTISNSLLLNKQNFHSITEILHNRDTLRNKLYQHIQENADLCRDIIANIYK